MGRAGPHSRGGTSAHTWMRILGVTRGKHAALCRDEEKNTPPAHLKRMMFHLTRAGGVETGGERHAHDANACASRMTLRRMPSACG